MVTAPRGRECPPVVRVAQLVAYVVTAVMVVTDYEDALLEKTPINPCALGTIIQPDNCTAAIDLFGVGLRHGEADRPPRARYHFRVPRRAVARNETHDDPVPVSM